MSREKEGVQLTTSKEWYFRPNFYRLTRETEERKLLRKGVKDFFAFCDLQPQLSLKDFLAKLEREILIEALSRLNGNQKLAAKALGLKHTTLNAKTRKYHISFFKGPCFGQPERMSPRKGGENSRLKMLNYG